MPDVLSAVFNSSEEDCDNFSLGDDSDRSFENPAENEDSSGLDYESEIDSFNDTANTSSTSIASDANNSLLEPGLNQSNEQNVSNVVSQSDAGSDCQSEAGISCEFPDELQTNHQSNTNKSASRSGNSRKRGRTAIQRPKPWEWSEVSASNDFTPKNITLAAQERIKGRLGDNPSVLDFFHLYISQEFLEILVEETNRYAEQYRKSHSEDIASGNMTLNWAPVDMNEMKTFIGLLLLMGIHFLPEINLYWSTHELYNARIHGESMRSDRFKQILRFWHFNDNDNYDPKDPDRDRLYKLRRLIDCLHENCRQAFEPGKNVCVDESLLLFKGRLHFRQYIRTKRARYGVKFYQLFTSDGVLLDFLIYCGTKLPEIEGLSATETIVATLMESYLHEGRCIFLDNFYTSPNLAKWLLENETFICGTVKSNRKQFPKELANKAIEKGQSIFYKCDKENILAVKY